MCCGRLKLTSDHTDGHDNDNNGNQTTLGDSDRVLRFPISPLLSAVIGVGTVVFGRAVVDGGLGAKGEECASGRRHGAGKVLISETPRMLTSSINYRFVRERHSTNRRFRE